MQGSARFALRHHLPGRTRFAFAGISPGDLREAILALGEAGIVVRHLDPRTGSLLLFHPRGLSVDWLRESLCSVLAGSGLPEAPAGMSNASDHRRPRPAAIRAQGPAPRAPQPLSEEAVAQLPLASPDEALARLGSRAGGLDSTEALRALEQFGR
jgi:hypothetical protein